MATHSSVLAWRIPGTEEPSGLPSMGSHRVGQRLKRLSSSSSSNYPKKVSEENDKKDYHYRSSWGYEIKQRDSNGGRKDTLGRPLIW